jgi:hypothetical protein
MARGQGFKRHPLPLALPHPGFKGGTFYLAKKRNFLLCVDNEISTDISYYGLLRRLIRTSRAVNMVSFTEPHGTLF